MYCQSHSTSIIFTLVSLPLLSPFADMHLQQVRPLHGLQVVIASYAEDEIQHRYYLTPFPVKAATDVPGDPGRNAL